MFDTRSTIAALSTPAGTAGRAIVRISGPAAVELAEQLFALAPRDGAPALRELGGFRWASGHVRLGAGMVVPAQAYVFRAPRSYTRDDVVELHFPGNPLLGALVLEQLIAAGARPARPGEFTLRAFLSGRLDLSAAEAVADVISAATDSQLRAASANAAGALGTLCRAWSDALAELLAEVEASIDLADEDIVLLDVAEFRRRLAEAQARMQSTLATAVQVTAAADVPRVAIAGVPNVGKSSLLNVLTGVDRAIVSATAGTTRDVLSAPLPLACGTEVLLQDLAGLTRPDDGIALAAADAAQSALASADLVLWVVDAGADGAPLSAEHRALLAARPARSVLLLANKMDLLAPGRAGSRLAELAAQVPFAAAGISAATGEGFGELKHRISDMLSLSADRSASGVALHEDQRRGIALSGEAIERALHLASGISHLGDAGETLSAELRTALGELGAISGAGVTEEVLGRIFARFCVGK